MRHQDGAEGRFEWLDRAQGLGEQHFALHGGQQCVGHLGATAEFIPADVRSDDQLAALVNDTTERYGRLDVAVNNAGTDGQMTPVSDITAGQYAGTFETNVLGTLLSMKRELRVMQAQRSGSIGNVSSIYGQKGFPGASLYVASKHAIIGLTRSAALEAAAYGVRVNAVGPARSRPPCSTGSPAVTPRPKPPTWPPSPSRVGRATDGP
jgi:NAD(P)-dependent dehydrogenase (short-subunit alcohol dehydrogenase family)